MKALIGATGKEAAKLDRFGPEIGDHLDDPVALARGLDGEWMELLGKILGAVVSAETKAKRLNSATCPPADFPVLLPVIQALAWGAPSKMWNPSFDDTERFHVGRVGPGESYGSDVRREAPPESHHRIAERIWYRPQLAMLVTALWPMSFGLEYYRSTLFHIINAVDIPGEGSAACDDPPNPVGLM